MKDVRYIVCHCTSTPVSQQVTVEDIDSWHRARGWSMIGYHWVIYQDGTIHAGRPESFAGAHVRGYNSHAIGVCYVGGINELGRYDDTRTPAQKASLWHLLKILRLAYPQARIIGHRDFPNVAKLCPCFDAQKEYSQLNGNQK